jgi:phosphoglycerate dehydrogenase-like enzyme
VTLTVLHQYGDDLTAAIEAAVPGVRVVQVPMDAVPDTGGEVLFCGFGPRLPVLDHLAELGVRWVHVPATGVDAYPLEKFRGVVLTCSRGASAVPIAEFVLAAMLAFEKRLPEVWLSEPPRHWNYAPLGGLEGRVLGLVGLGSIGTAVATRALAFGMQVLGFRRHPERGSPVPGVTVVADLDALLGAADHLVLAAPATARTRHLLDAAAFARMKPGVHLVNVARGSLVDQEALRVALDQGVVALASLDVCEPEPLPAGHWLYAHPRVHLSPHCSWASHEPLASIPRIFLDNLRRWVAGEPLEGVVDLDEGY